MQSFLITEWNHNIGDEVQGGDPWKKNELFELSEKDVWIYLLNAMEKIVQGAGHPHFSIKELTSKISSRSIKGKDDL